MIVSLKREEKRDKRKKKHSDKYKKNERRLKFKTTLGPRRHSVSSLLFSFLFFINSHTVIPVAIPFIFLYLWNKTSTVGNLVYPIAINDFYHPFSSAFRALRRPKQALGHCVGNREGPESSYEELLGKQEEISIEG